MVGGAICIQNPTPFPPDSQRAQTNLVRPRDPTETETEPCLSVACGGKTQQWTATGTGALGTADLGMALDLFEKVTSNPTTELPELTQDQKIDSWRAQTEP